MTDTYFSNEDVPSDPNERLSWALAMRAKYSAGDAAPKQPKFKGGKWKDSDSKNVEEPAPAEDTK